MEAPTQTFEFTCEWFERAASNAKANRKLDSAQLWQDGLDQLRHIASQRDGLASALQGLKTIIELAVAREDGTQYAYIETRRGSFVHVIDALEKAGAALRATTA